MIISLNNLKAADLKSLEVDGEALEVTLKGCGFYVKKAPAGAPHGYTVDEGRNKVYPFNSLADLKDYVRNCAAAYAEEEQEETAKAPKGWTEVEAGHEAQPKPKCPSVSDLAYQVTESGNLFFTKKTMKFFGDTLGNYGTRMVQQQDGSWIIELFRRKPVKHNTSSSAYFDAVTFKRLHSVTLKDGQ